MFNFVEIFELLSSRGACVMVRNEDEFVQTCLDILTDPARAEHMHENCLAVVAENQGATKRNLDELKKLLDRLHLWG